MKAIGILSYGTGNISSISKAIERLGYTPEIVRSADDILKVSRLILPGVGHFGAAMRSLNETKLTECIKSASLKGVPILGICLGFQILCATSEEDSTINGLGLFPFSVSRLTESNNVSVKIPQIGWNSISSEHGSPKLLVNVAPGMQSFYYANAFGVRADNVNFPFATYVHGDNYVALVENGLVFGVQFHPEKSGKQGLEIIKKFLET